MIDAEIFARYLDLEPLGRRRRGLVSCIFRRERTPSLSVDLDRGLFHCFGCGAQGGALKFAELVGEPRSGNSLIKTPTRWESPLSRARREILDEARRQPWHREDIRLLYEISDPTRCRRRAVLIARAIATRAGDRAEAWDLLATAASVERQAHAIEAELDDIMRAARARDAA